MSQRQPDGVAVDLVDFSVLDRWMVDQGLPSGEFANVQLLTGGTQNVLIRFERGDNAYVLRRPPRHLRPRSNDNLRREARILGALTGSGVAAPGLIAACGDESVMGGAAFFLMEAIDGFNPSSHLPETHRGPEARHAMGLNATAAAAELGAVDYLAVGLADFGQPEGFLDRQVPRWLAELDSYGRHDGYPGPKIPGLEAVSQWLGENKPSGFTPGIMHGDFHLANLLFSFDGPELAAIVDWEMCTIGDPLLDLGWLIATRPEPTDLLGAMAGEIGRAGGWPTRRELAEHYAQRSTRNLSNIQWYAVLACFKLGIVLEGTYARSCAGKADPGVGEMFRAITCALFERGQTFIEETW